MNGFQVRNQSNIWLKRGNATLRFPIVSNEYCLGRDPKWSSFEIPQFGWEILSRRHAIFRKEDNHYRIIDGDGNRSSRNGTFINQVKVDTQKGTHLKPGMEVHFGQDPANQVKLIYLEIDQISIKNNCYKGSNLDLEKIQKWPVILGRTQAVHGTTLLLEAPNISRQHATINRDLLGNYILQDNSTNGTIVNHQRVVGEIQLKRQDIIRIGPYQIKFLDSSLVINTSLEEAW